MLMHSQLSVMITVLILKWANGTIPIDQLAKCSFHQAVFLHVDCTGLLNVGQQVDKAVEVFVQ